jgi:dihydrofolate reductase
MIFFDLAVSLDGFIAGPDQSADDPIGAGGMDLHRWKFDDAAMTDTDRAIVALHAEGVGAGVMGRNMFSPGRGEWDPEWKGWWGPNPPYGFPVFVLTHHAREPLEMEGGTTFHFVTDGFDAALERARAAAGDRHVQITGGASAVNHAQRAGAVHHIPILLGSGERLFDGVAPSRFDIARVLDSPSGTYVIYRRQR